MTPAYAPITLGARIQSVSAVGYIVTETEHASGKVLPRHAHENANIALIRRGSFVEAIGRREWNVTAGSAIFKPAGADHANRYGDGGMSCVVVELLPEYVDAAPIARRLDDTVVSEDSRLGHLTESLHEELAATDASAAMAVEGLVLQILATLLRVRTPPERQAPRWLDQFRDALHEQGHGSLRIGDAARQIGVHPTHAVREFKRRFGTTPADYVRRLRIDRACELLRSGVSPADAAVAAGFAHQSHLTRLLKRYRSVTPGQYVHRFR